MRRLNRSCLSIALALTLQLTTWPAATAQTILTRSIKVYVKGMVCAFCAQGLTKTFRAQAGIVAVDARLEEGAILLQIRAEVPLPEAKIRELVEDAGFDVLRIDAVAPTT